MNGKKAKMKNGKKKNGRLSARTELFIIFLSLSSVLGMFEVGLGPMKNLFVRLLMYD
jgi:hypothetical protein